MGDDYDSDEEKSQLDKLRYANIPRGMNVSGWDDDTDELIQEDRNPQGLQSQLIIISDTFMIIHCSQHRTDDPVGCQ